MDTGFAPLADHVRSIQALCARRVSGMVMLVSDDNRMAQLHLRDGAIVFVVCRGRRGRNALEQLRTIPTVRMRLDEVIMHNEGPPMPPTGVILAYLSGEIASLPEDEAPDAAPPAAARTGTDASAASRSSQAPASAARPSARLIGDVRAAVSLALAEYIGPIAGIVCDEHFNAGHDSNALMDALAGEISEPDEALAFRRQVAGLLATLG